MDNKVIEGLATTFTRISKNKEEIEKELKVVFVSLKPKKWTYQLWYYQYTCRLHLCIFNDRIIEAVNKYGIISTRQRGFRKGARISDVAFSLRHGRLNFKW